MSTPAPTKLTGTVIGTPGSFQSKGNVGANALAGAPTKFFDAPDAEGCWVGLDLGTPYVIVSASLAPRPGWLARLQGGEIQGANDPAFATPTTLATVITPTLGLQTLIINNPTPFRYVRYIGGANSYCNVSDLSFAGSPSTVVSPTASTVITPKLTFLQTPLPPVPCTVHFDSLASFGSGDWRYSVAPTNRTEGVYHSTSIVVTAPNGSIVWNEPSPFCAFVATIPGNYTIKTTIDGTTATAIVNVPSIAWSVEYFDAVAGNDSNSGTQAAPKKSISGLVCKANTQYLLKRGTTDNLTAEVNNTATNVRFDCWGDPTQPLPVLNWTVPIKTGGDPASIFTTWTNTTNFTVANVYATSVAGPTGTSYGKTYRPGSATLCNARGTNLAFENIEFDCLNRFLYIVDVAGLRRQNCRQMTPDGITSQVVYVGNLSHFATLGNTDLGSALESPDRETESGQNYGIRAHNEVENAYLAKAAITDRVETYVHSFGNTTRKASYSIDMPDVPDGVHFDQSSLYENETTYDVPPQIKSGPRGVITRNWTINVPTGPGFGYSAPQGAANVLDGHTIVLAAAAIYAQSDCGVEFYSSDTTAVVKNLKVTGPKDALLCSGAPAGVVPTGTVNGMAK